MKIYYSIDYLYSNGDVVEKGIFLHFEETSILVAADEYEFDEFVEQILRIQSNIGDTLNK
jgi:hypothetical protein